MSRNMSSLIFEEVSKTNKNRYNITKEVLVEDSYHLDPRFDRANSFYGKAKIEEDGDTITLISYNTPIVKVANGNFEFLCDEKALTQTTMRHIRDFLKQMDYDGKINLSGKDYPITIGWVKQHLNNKINESVTIEGNENKDDDFRNFVDSQLRDGAIDDPEYVNNLSAEEYEDLLTNTWMKDEDMINAYNDLHKNDNMNESAKVLTEAPEDEEFEVNDEELPMDEPIEEPIEEPVEDEMTNDEVQDEVEEDEEETIKDDIEQPFYATTPEFDELRDLLVDLDYRLFLINDNMVCIGRLNGPDIEFLTSNRPEDTDTEVSEQNEKAEEIENKAEEDGEQAFEYKWIKAPESLKSFLNQVNVVYLSPEMSDEDKEQYAGIEASHESVMDFLMNELPEDKKKEHEEEEIDDEVPEELPPVEEPREDEFPEEEFEEPIEEPIEDEEEEEEE